MNALARIASIVTAAGLAAAIGGCASGPSEPVRLLRTEDFLADPAESRAVAQSPVMTEDSIAAEGQPILVARESGPSLRMREEATEGITDVRAVAGAPDLSRSASAQPISTPILIDAKIGEINGRPVRVDEILIGRNLEGVFTANASEPGMTRVAWLQDVQQKVRKELEWLLQDELLRAEALASLKPEQRIGLRHMVREMTEDLRREAGGSRAAAEARLRETGTASTFAEMERKREAQILVDYQLHDKIRRNIRVSWKDVRLYYERNHEVFNPPAEAYLRIIRVPASRAEDVAKIQRALDDGVPFAEVAKYPENMFNAAGGGLQDRPITFTGDLAEAQLSLVEPMAATLRTLKPGEYNREPIEFRGSRGTDSMWIHLDSVRQRSRPLSDRDVQREIAEQLTRQLTEREINRHINRLMERASFTDLDAMTRRIVEIAAERYWPQRG